MSTLKRYFKYTTKDMIEYDETLGHTREMYIERIEGETYIDTFTRVVRGRGYPVASWGRVESDEIPDPEEKIVVDKNCIVQEYTKIMPEGQYDTFVHHLNGDFYGAFKDYTYIEWKNKGGYGLLMTSNKTFSVEPLSAYGYNEDLSIRYTIVPSRDEIRNSHNDAVYEKFMRDFCRRRSVTFDDEYGVYYHQNNFYPIGDPRFERLYWSDSKEKLEKVAADNPDGVRKATTMEELQDLAKTAKSAIGHFVNEHKQDLKDNGGISGIKDGFSDSIKKKFRRR